LEQGAAGARTGGREAEAKRRCRPAERETPGVTSKQSTGLESMEGRTDMSRCRRRSLNESGRAAAVTIACPGANRLSRHFACRFCLYFPSVVLQGSILPLNPLRDWGHVCTFTGGHRSRAKVLWEMSILCGRSHRRFPAMHRAGGWQRNCDLRSLPRRVIIFSSPGQGARVSPGRCLLPAPGADGRG
jgi:hypothetical protein